jgi:tRNA A-37 threonylcarbamoyl transferase component Bud32/tetratricopeptide (TPR) repeat protein
LPIDPLLEQLTQSLGGTYAIERELGGGGMSRVFAAREIALDRRVVIKVLPPDLAAGVSFDRFRREIQVAARLQQANIVPVLAAGDGDGVAYYVMPFVQGESLRQQMKQRGALPVPEVVSIVRDVSRALAAAHAEGIVHRDIKPENILLSGGAAVVTDFGIAKAIAAARETGNADAVTSDDDALTVLGTSLGTPAYMSPEQAAGDPATDHRSDVYALGVVAYEALAGRSLFDARSTHEMVTAHMTEAPVPISTRRPDVPEPLAALIMRCLAKNPAERPASAAAILASLESNPGVAPASRANLRRSLAVYGVTFAVVALVARLAIAWIGLPEWVFPAALVVMALGLPATLLLTPARAVRGGLAAVGGLVAVTAGYMALRALGIGPAGSLFAQGVLKDRDAVVITDFRAVKADSSLAAMLGEAVRTALAESNALRVVPTNDVREALVLMRRDPSLPLDAAVARDVALRTRAKAVVDGDVSGVGGGAGYLVSLRLVSADSGRELATFHAAADGPRQLIETADALARKLRAKAGESLRLVNRSPDLWYVSTSSIDALRAYTLGRQAMNHDSVEKAMVLLRAAVSVDSTFAMAWSSIGNVAAVAGMTALADSARSRAYALRDRLTEYERLWVTSAYLGFPNQRAPREAEAAMQTLVDRGDSSAALANLATMFLNHRDYAHADPLFRVSVHRRGSDPVGAMSFVALLFNEGKIAESESVFAAMQTARPRYPLVPRWAAEFAYQRSDLDAVARIADSARTSPAPGQQVWGATRLASLALLRGHAADYERYLKMARATDAARHSPVPWPQDSILFAYRDVWMSATPTHGLARLDAALARQPLDTSIAAYTHFLAAMAYAIGGRVDRARQVLARYDAGAVLDTVRRRLDDPARHLALGEIALTEKRWRDAIAEFRRSDSTSLGLPSGVCRTCVYGPLGRAFDRAGMPDSAIVFYEMYLKTPYFMRGDETKTDDGRGDAYWSAMISRRLGELYEQKGDRAKAADNYGRFVSLWNTADPEFQPVVAEARTALARLKVEGR